jgi:hypothetical protein
VDIPRLPELPPGVRRDMVQDSAVQMNRFIDATSRIAQDFARRWQDGLTRTDLEQFGQSFGTEMTNYAVQALDSMMGNFRPKSKDEPTACAEPAVVSSVDKPGPIDRVGDVAREMVEQTKCAGEIAADRIDDDAYTASALIETASKLANIAIKGWIDLAGIALDQLAGEDSARTDDLTAASHRIADQATTISDAATLNAAAPVTIRGNGFGALMRTLTEIANLTFHRGVDLVETAIGQRPATGTTVLADHMTTIVRRMADHTRMVADDAAHKLDAEGYGPDDWAESMTKFGDVALVNGVELVGTALVGPSRYEVEPIRSDPFAVEHTDSRPRALSIATPLVLAGTDDAIAEHRITFEPPGGVLAPSEKVFRLRVRAAGLRSGVYTGSIRVGKLDESAPDNDVGEEIVPVVIGL